MRIYALYFTSIICGFCLMALEMLGSRFLAPEFGTALDVWSAIITVFILALSIGYVVGGRLADRSNSNLPLGVIITVSGIFYLLLPVYARSVTSMLGGAGGTLHAQAFDVLIAANVLFFIPSVLLGCVSPMLVKLVFKTASKVGRTTGNLYAIGSFGNVLGILCTTYILLKAFSINGNMIGMGVVLCLTGLAHVFVRTEAKRKPASLEGVDTGADTITEVDPVS